VRAILVLRLDLYFGRTHLRDISYFPKVAPHPPEPKSFISRTPKMKCQGVKHFFLSGAENSSRSKIPRASLYWTPKAPPRRFWARSQDIFVDRHIFPSQGRRTHRDQNSSESHSIGPPRHLQFDFERDPRTFLSRNTFLLLKGGELIEIKIPQSLTLLDPQGTFSSILSGIRRHFCQGTHFYFSRAEDSSRSKFLRASLYWTPKAPSVRLWARSKELFADTRTHGHTDGRTDIKY